MATSRESNRADEPDKKQVDFFTVQDTARKHFPAGDNLDFIKKKGGPLLIPPLWIQAIIFFDEHIQVSCMYVGQALIFKAEIQQSFAGRSPGKAVSQNLPKQACFA